MTNKETQQIGKLTGQMEIIVQSLASLHDKVEAFRDRCDPCRKDILEAAKQAALNITNTKSFSLERWIMRGIISVLFLMCGYLIMNHFMPNVINMPAAAEIQAIEKK